MLPPQSVSIRIPSQLCGSRSCPVWTVRSVRIYTLLCFCFESAANYAACKQNITAFHLSASPARWKMRSSITSPFCLCLLHSLHRVVWCYSPSVNRVRSARNIPSSNNNKFLWTTLATKLNREGMEGVHMWFPHPQTTVWYVLGCVSRFFSPWFCSLKEVSGMMSYILLWRLMVVFKALF